METLELKKDKVYIKLKHDIISGKLASGKKLLCEPELAKELSVGRITLRDSLARLEDEGYIRRIHGKGTFVYPDNVTPSTATLMVIHGTENSAEHPWRYIVPEITSFAAEKNLKTFITTNATINMFSESDIRTFVKSSHVIGIVALMNNFTGQEPILKKIKSAEVPVVLTHGKPHDGEVTGFAVISVSEKDGWKTAIAYLAELGHRRIGIIGDADSGFRGCSRRETLQLLDKYHACADESMICLTDFDKDNVARVVEFLLSRSVTAILCFSDFYAIYVYDAIKKLKLRIPEDVAVMGICGYPDARLLSPPLSTVDYGYAEFGKMAVEMLKEPEKWFDPITGKGKQRMKPYKLIKRQSTEQKTT